MKSKAKAATKAEKKRFEKIVEIGCVACHMAGRKGEPCEIHHLLDGGVRIGHSSTVGLCGWCHRGVPPGKQWPSLANGHKRFKEWFGSDDELLEYQNILLASAEFKG